MKKKISEKILSIQTRVESKAMKTKLAVAGALVTAIGTVAPGYCCGLDTAINKLITAGLGLLQAVGIILAAVGIGQVVMQILGGLRGEGEMQMNKIATGIGFVAAGVVLFSLKTILGALGINATSVTTGL